MSFNIRWFLVVCAIHFSFLPFVGCQKKTEVNAVASHGPHGGHNLEVSQVLPYSLEFTLDEKTRKIIIYVYENSGNKPCAIPVDQIAATFESGGLSFDSSFHAEPRVSDPQGCSSRFSLSVDTLPQQLMNARDFKIKLSYLVGGQTITALLQHQNNHGHYYKHD